MEVATVEARKHKNDPVFVDRKGQKIEMRIGHPRVGETRYAMLTAAEALAVAGALIDEARTAEEIRTGTWRPPPLPRVLPPGSYLPRPSAGQSAKTEDAGPASTE